MNDSERLAIKISEEILAVFPDSCAKALFSNRIMPMLTISFTLGKDKNEWINGIHHNDPAHHTFFVYGMNNLGEIQRDLTLERHIGSIITKSTVPHLTYMHMKIPFRKATGDETVILKSVRKYFENLKATLQKTRDKLTEHHLKLIGDKF